MAKVLYGVAGEGLGHATRSKVVIKHLSKNNKIKVVSADRAYSFLKRFFDVEEIGYFNIVYRNNKVANILLLLNAIIKFPLIITKSWKINSIIRNFKPDLIITDF